MNPKFEEHLQSRIRQAERERATQRYGVVMAYDNTTNTATVLLSASDGTDSLGDVINNVPCPVVLGVQNVAPEPGRPCWVAFKSEREGSPIITHFFNHAYNQFDHTKQTVARNTTPNFLINM